MKNTSTTPGGAMLPLEWKTVPLSSVMTYGGHLADIDGVFVVFDEIGVLRVGQSKSIQRELVAFCHATNVFEFRNGGTLSCAFTPVNRLLKDSVERYLFDALQPAMEKSQPPGLPCEVKLPYELSYVTRHRLDALSVADTMPSYSFAP